MYIPHAMFAMNPLCVCSMHHACMPAGHNALSPWGSSWHHAFPALQLLSMHGMVMHCSYTETVACKLINCLLIT